MYIDTIAIRNHKILGDATISLTGKSSRRVKMTPGCNVEIVTADDDKNRYTYIIGSNGAGKSTLFTTIINYIYGQMHPLKASVARALTYQSQMFTSPFPQRRRTCEAMNFLFENDNLRVIHISNSSTVLSEGDFEEFIELHPFSDNTSLRMLPLIYKGVDKLDDLLSFVPHREGCWSMIVSFADLLDSPIELNTKGCMALLYGDKDVNALSLITYLEDGQKQDINRSAIDNAIVKASRGETDTLCASLNEICGFVRRSRIYSHIKEYFSKASDDYVIQDEDGKPHTKIVFIPSMEGKDSWFDIDIREFIDDDLVAIPILVKMGILKFKIMLDNVPIDSMSSGEKVMIGLFAALAKFANVRAENILMLYDEPENSLHPEWQQMFPLLFHNVVDKVYGIKRSHFIFATHSPLIVQRANDSSANTSTVIKFTKKDGNLHTETIRDSHRYCIEELMMDQFGVAYREAEVRQDMDEYILQNQNEDPIKSVVDSRTLRDEIDRLYADICKDE